MVTITPTALSLDLATDADHAAWDQFVSAHPRASGYHLWAWRAVFERAFAHETAYIVARSGDRMVGALPLVLFRTALFGQFAVSLPFVNYGGVLAEDEATARALLDYASDLASRRRLSHVELRHTNALFPDLPSKQHKVGMHLPLPSTAAIAWDSLDRKVRNQVRKAEKSNLTVQSGGPELLDSFYDVFARNMRDLGTPVYDRRFFREVFRQFPSETRVFLVQLQSATIAAGITYQYGQRIEMPWASALKEHRSLCGNVLLYWHAIQYAIEQRGNIFDFGRSTPHEGTYKFKEQWGAQPQPVCWEYRLLAGQTLPDQSPKNPKFKPAIAIWKHLPLSVTTFIGPRIVRAIP